MTSTDDIARLLAAMAGKGYWTTEEMEEVTTIMGRPMDYVPEGTKGQWPIAGDDEPRLRLDDSEPGAHVTLSLTPRPDLGPGMVEASNLETRVKHLEGMQKHLWDKIAALEKRLGVGRMPDE